MGEMNQYATYIRFDLAAAASRFLNLFTQIIKSARRQARTKQVLPLALRMQIRYAVKDAKKWEWMRRE
jgi:hypothetical protein